jgi:hypothetical protein
MSDNAMKLLSERVRARVRRGASTRHSLLWWWLWEQRAQLEELIRAGEVSWAATAEVMAAIGLVGATGKPVEGGGLRKTWVRMLAEAPAEAARMAEAAKQRRHARARKVEGKISRARTPLAKAAEKHRQEQIAKAGARYARRWRRWQKAGRARMSGPSCSLQFLRLPPRNLFPPRGRRGVCGAWFRRARPRRR